MEPPSTRTGSNKKVRITKAMSTAAAMVTTHSNISRFRVFLGFSFWPRLAGCVLFSGVTGSSSDMGVRLAF